MTFDEALCAAYDAGYQRGCDDTENVNKVRFRALSFEEWRATLSGLDVE